MNVFEAAIGDHVQTVRAFVILRKRGPVVGRIAEQINYAPGRLVCGRFIRAGCLEKRWPEVQQANRGRAGCFRRNMAGPAHDEWNPGRLIKHASLSE